MSISLPASEIIKKTEEQLSEAQKKRLAALELLNEAGLIEEQAKAFTVDSMGAENGLMAFELAKWSVSSREEVSVPSTGLDVLPSKVDEGVEKVDRQVVEEPSKVVKSTKVKALQSKRDNRDKYFGANVPSSRVLEAEEILVQVASYVSQGRKGNPFANDRGKNAWRKALFNAAYVSMVANGVEHAAAAESMDSTEVESAEVSSESFVVPARSTKQDRDMAVQDRYSADEFEELSREESSEEELDGDFDVPDLSEIIDEDVFITSHDEVFDDDFDASDDYVENTDGQLAAPSDVSDSAVIEDSVSDAGEETIINSSPDVSAFDPFDDYDELPPANPAPPPRGFVPSSSLFGKSEVEDAGVKASSVEKEGVPAPPSTSGVDFPQAHVPRPIPPHRRPGNGQALQSPVTLPSTVASLNKEGSSKPLFSPPSFLTRKA